LGECSFCVSDEFLLTIILIFLVDFTSLGIALIIEKFLLNILVVFIIKLTIVHALHD